MFKNLSRAFVLVSLCALFTTAVASKPAAHLSRESLERRILDSAAAGTRMLKQFDVRRAPHRDATHARRQVSAPLNEFVAAATQTPAANTNGLVVLAVKTQTAAPTLKTGLASREVKLDSEDLSLKNFDLNGSDLLDDKNPTTDSSDSGASDDSGFDTPDIDDVVGTFGAVLR